MKAASVFVAISAAFLTPALALADVPAATTPATAPIVTPGKMLYSGKTGKDALAPIYRVAADGSPQVLLEGRIITIPADTLTSADGKVATTLSKREIMTKL